MILEAVDLGVDIDNRTILSQVHLACRPGTMTALVGPSGSGKTTLLHCLGLLQVPTSGRVLVDGTPTEAWGSSRRRRFWRESASFVLQDYGIVLEESVAFNVTLASSLWGRRAVGDRPRMLDALSATGLTGRADDLASHLSGGERQRLAVARSIYKQARVLCVDEPTASLDGANRDVVVDLLRERARAGCTVVIATHDPVVIDGCDVAHHVGRVAEPSDLVRP